MPLPVRIGAHPGHPVLADISRRHRPKSVPPEADGLVADINPALMEKILHIAQRGRKPNTEHHSQADDFRTGFEVAKRGAFGHAQTLRNRPARLKPVSSDRTSHWALGFFCLGDVILYLQKTVRRDRDRVNSRVDQYLREIRIVRRGLPA